MNQGTSQHATTTTCALLCVNKQVSLWWGDTIISLCHLPLLISCYCSMVLSRISKLIKRTYLQLSGEGLICSSGIGKVACSNFRKNIPLKKKQAMLYWRTNIEARPTHLYEGQTCHYCGNLCFPINIKKSAILSIGIAVSLRAIKPEYDQRSTKRLSNLILAVGVRGCCLILRKTTFRFNRLKNTRTHHRHTG